MVLDWQGLANFNPLLASQGGFLASLQGAVVKHSCSPYALAWSVADTIMAAGCDRRVQFYSQKGKVQTRTQESCPIIKHVVYNTSRTHFVCVWECVQYIHAIVGCCLQKLQQFDYSKDEREKEFTCASTSPSGEAVVLGSFDRYSHTHTLSDH